VRLVERMLGDPPHCLVCGKGNTPDGDTGEIGPFLDLAREINWADDCYLCVDCSVKIGTMVGCMTPTDLQDLEAEKKALELKVHDLTAELDSVSRKRRAAEKRVEILANAERVKERVQRRDRVA
jgi:hypothetical protein